MDHEGPSGEWKATLLSINQKSQPKCGQPGHLLRWKAPNSDSRSRGFRRATMAYSVLTGRPSRHVYTGATASDRFSACHRGTAWTRPVAAQGAIHTCSE